MNKLSIEQMSQISGGNFWDGFCVAVGVGNLLGAAISITGVGLAVLVIADVGCLAYAASKL